MSEEAGEERKAGFLPSYHSLSPLSHFLALVSFVAKISGKTQNY